HVVLVANFETAATEVEITPRFEDQSTARPQAVPVGGRSVGVFDVAAFAGSGSPVGVDVRATRPSSGVVGGLAWWGPPAAGTGAGARGRPPRWRARWLRPPGRSRWAGPRPRRRARSAWSTRVAAGRRSPCRPTHPEGVTPRVTSGRWRCRRGGRAGSISVPRV